MNYGIKPRQEKPEEVLGRHLIDIKDKLSEIKRLLAKIDEKIPERTKKAS